MDISALANAVLLGVILAVALIVLRGMKRKLDQAKDDIQKLQQCPPHAWEEREQKIAEKTYYRLFCTKCERYFGDF